VRKPAARTSQPAPARTTKAKATPGPNEPAQAASAKAAAKPKAAKLVPAKPETTTLLEALTSGQAVLIKVRANGTQRSLPYLAPKRAVRETAMMVETRRQAGETLETIVEEMNVSIATVRRYISNLALAHETEDGKYDSAWTKGTKAVIVHTVQATA
jgi:hypothetical protein